jgi:LysM repeat protein
MTNPDDFTNKNFEWHDNYSREEQFDSYENDTNEASNKSARIWFSMPVVIGAVAFAIIVVLLFVVLTRGQNYAGEKQILVIEKRLDRLESEFTSLKTYIASKLDQAIKEMERDRRTAAARMAPSSQIPPAGQTEQENVEPKVHKVLPGESLSRISRYYGLTIKQLRDYNNLEPNATIYPGQELKLIP